MLSRTVLALCAIGAVSGTSTIRTVTSNRARRQTFLDVVSDKSERDNYKTPVIPAELPIKLGGHGGTNLPVLIVPVPFPVYTKGKDSCDASDKSTNPPIYPPYIAVRSHEDLPDTRSRAGFKTVDIDDNDDDSPIIVVDEESVTKPPRRRVTVTKKVVNNKPGQRVITDEDVIFNTPSSRQRVKTVTENKIFKIDHPKEFTKEVISVTGHDGASRQRGNVKGNPTPFLSFEDYQSIDLSAEQELNGYQSLYEPVEDYLPFSYGRDDVFGSTPRLIRSYLQETPLAPQLPAVVPRGRVFPNRIPVRGPEAPVEATIPAPSPPRPEFDKPMRLRIDLTVPRADFTTAYDLAWHAGSNTARTVVEDGNAIFYRVPLLDGRLQYLKYKIDRMNGSTVQRCTLSPLLPASPADKTIPGLPDFSRFHFVGYTEAEGHSPVERWRHWVIGRPGEIGAARGEALNYTHEFLLYRDQGNLVPLKYTVVTHSSVLGPNSDTYTHRYHLLPAPTAPFLPDTSQCDIMTQMKEESFEPSNGQGDSARKYDSTDRGRDLNKARARFDFSNGGFGVGYNPDVGVAANLNSEAGSRAGLSADITGHFGSGSRAGSTFNSNFGTRGKAKFVDNAASENIHFGADANAGLTADNIGVAGSSNFGAGAGGGLTAGKVGATANSNFGIGDFGTGIFADNIGASAKLDLGTEGVGVGAGLSADTAEPNANTRFRIRENAELPLSPPNSNIGVRGNAGLGSGKVGSNLNIRNESVGADQDAGKRGFDVDLNDRVKSIGGAVSAAAALATGAVSAAKDFFNPIAGFLGLTRPAKYDAMFDEFKNKYKRKYRDNDEEAVRKTKFIHNNRYIETANLIADTFILGTNFIADRVKEELTYFMNGVPRRPPGVSPSSSGYEPEFASSKVQAYLDNPKNMVPEKFSWIDEGFKTTVHFQGETCNSCALMATTGATEGALFALKRPELRALSPQDMIDCGMLNGGNVLGCNQTTVHDAYLYIKKNGLPSLEDYRFLSGEKATCKEVKKRVTKIKTFYDVIPRDEDVLRLVINKRSPVVVVLSGVHDAKSIHSMKEGTLDDTRWCSEKSLEGRHAVLAVGYDFTNNKKSFTIKNSWGKHWAQGGYADLEATHCYILDEASYPIVTQEDVLE